MAAAPPDPGARVTLLAAALLLLPATSLADSPPDAREGFQMHLGMGATVPAGRATGAAYGWPDSGTGGGGSGGGSETGVGGSGAAGTGGGSGGAGGSGTSGSAGSSIAGAGGSAGGPPTGGSAGSPTGGSVSHLPSSAFLTPAPNKTRIRVSDALAAAFCGWNKHLPLGGTYS
jgi:hypothetical protein